MTAMASQITDFCIICSTVCWGADHWDHQISASLAFVRGIHQLLVDSPHKGPVMQKKFPFDDIIMDIFILNQSIRCGLQPASLAAIAVHPPFPIKPHPQHLIPVRPGISPIMLSSLMRLRLGTITTLHLTLKLLVSYINGLVQDCSISSVLPVKIL